MTERTQRGGSPLTLGRFLQAIRLGEEQTLDAFAAQLGISKQHLSDVEHDRRGVSVERAAAWAETLGYHPGQFVELAVQAQLQAARLPFSVLVRRVGLAPRPRSVSTAAGTRQDVIARVPPREMVDRVAARAKAKRATPPTRRLTRAADRKRK